MSDLDRLGTVLAICVFVVALAWASRKAALDMDERGWPGWIFGILVLVVPPLGMLLWLGLRTIVGSRNPNA